MEWTALWLGSLLERLKPESSGVSVREPIRQALRWVMFSSLSARGNHPAWAWAIGVVIPAVLVEALLTAWSGWLGWLLQLTLIYFTMAWGQHAARSEQQRMDSSASEVAVPRPGQAVANSQVLLHDVLAPLIMLLLGQIIGLEWLVLVGYLLARQWQRLIESDEELASPAAAQWSSLAWQLIDVITTRLALLIAALVGRFDAVFGVWLDQSPRWHEKHQALWHQGLQAAIGSSVEDNTGAELEKQEWFASRAVLVLIGLNTVWAWL